MRERDTQRKTERESVWRNSTTKLQDLSIKKERDRKCVSVCVREKVTQRMTERERERVCGYSTMMPQNLSTKKAREKKCVSV